MIRSCSSLLLGLAATIGASLMLYHTSDRVAALDRRLTEINEEIEAEEESLHVLRADWVYLANPARVEGQAFRYLNMQPTELQRIMTSENIGKVLPLNSESPTMVAEAPQEPVSDNVISGDVQSTKPSDPLGKSDKPVYAALNEGRINDHVILRHASNKNEGADNASSAPDMTDLAKALTESAGTTEGVGALLGTLGLSQ